MAGGCDGVVVAVANNVIECNLLNTHLQTPLHLATTPFSHLLTFFWAFTNQPRTGWAFVSTWDHWITPCAPWLLTMGRVTTLRVVASHGLVICFFPHAHVEGLWMYMDSRWLKHAWNGSIFCPRTAFHCTPHENDQDICERTVFIVFQFSCSESHVHSCSICCSNNSSCRVYPVIDFPFKFTKQTFQIHQQRNPHPYQVVALVSQMFMDCFFWNCFYMFSIRGNFEEDVHFDLSKYRYPIIHWLHGIRHPLVVRSNRFKKKNPAMISWSWWLVSLQNEVIKVKINVNIRFVSAAKTECWKLRKEWPLEQLATPRSWLPSLRCLPCCILTRAAIFCWTQNSPQHHGTHGKTWTRLRSVFYCISKVGDVSNEGSLISKHQLFHTFYVTIFAHAFPWEVLTHFEKHQTCTVLRYSFSGRSHVAMRLEQYI